MWKIDSDGNAANEFGEWIFFTVSVHKQERGCGGRRHWLGDFKSTDDARDFIRQTVDQLNAEGNQNARRPMDTTSD